MSSRPNGSPPPYEPQDGFHPPSQPAYSYYPDDEFQHFYRWTSPPGILKIMAVLAIVLCVGIFACVASTLAYDGQGAMTAFGYPAGGYGGGYGGSYGGGYGGSYSGGYGSGYGTGGLGFIDPRPSKGFMIAMAAMVFIFCMATFIIIVSHHSLAESRKFYLAVVIVSAVLALLMLIATITYLVAVNPAAQSTGSYSGNQAAMMCAPYNSGQAMGVFTNQYLYHFCVVEPQEAIAMVFGFLVTAALIIILVFALKTRQKIGSYGKSNIFWKKVKAVDEVMPPQDVEAWVNNVSAPPDDVTVADYYPEKLRGSRSHLDDDSYDKPPLSYTPQPAVAADLPLQSAAPYSSSSSEVASSAGKPKRRRPGRPRTATGPGYDTDYNSSGDELDDNDFDSEFPPIRSDQERSAYKQEFDRDHQEYKDLQAHLDGVNKDLSELDAELDQLEEGSPQYLDVLDEYNRVRDIKKTPDYQVQKRRCKYLKSKLNHVKKMVSDYDRRA